jgi:AraC-like DNA-binding protein
MIEYRESHHAIYPAHYQLLLLMELLDEQGIDHHHYLKGTGLFYDDVISGQKYIAAVQYIKLIENAQKLGDSTLAFRWGHAILPGHYDVFTQLLHNTSNLSDVLVVLQRYSEVLCPMMKPIVLTRNEYAIIYWRDEMGISTIQTFLAEAYTTALLSVCHWLAKCKYPWRLGFAYNEPNYVEEYDVNFGENIQFGLGVNILVLEQNYVEQPWPDMQASLTVFALLERKAQTEYARFYPGFIGVITQWSQRHLRQHANLAQTSAAFNMSSATLKRKLKSHNTSFQKVQDQARLSTCLYLLHHKHWSNQQVADYLQFSDTNNFRKAFKRWCGNTPNDMREKLEFNTGVV